MSGFLRLPHHRGGVVGINPSVCVLFMTQHLLHSLFSSSFSLTLTRCSSIAITCVPHFFFSSGVKCTQDETFSILVSVSLHLTLSFSIFLSLSLSILSQFQSLHHVSKVCEGWWQWQSCWVQPSCSHSTLLCRKKPQGCGREQQGVQIWQGRMYGFEMCFAHGTVHSVPYIPICSLLFGMKHLWEHVIHK